ncbi:MAG: helix-turn-helix domain-containing protein [Pseudomonadota bacterium]
MSESSDSSAPIGVASLDGTSAGALLRRARETRGLHIAALAASIKVSPRKLEALESDRYADLPDMTFTRALAQTVCRALKIDAEPVLGKLPQAGDMPKLSQLGGGLNAPFRAPSGGHDPGDFTFHRKPVFWATLLVLGGAMALALLPERWMPWRGTAGNPAWVPGAASTAVGIAAPASAAESLAASAPVAAPVSASGPVVSGTGAAAEVAAPASASVAAAPLTPIQASDKSAAPAGTAAALAVRTTAESWVEVQDGRGQNLLSRVVQPGETVGLDGALPLRVTIGNAAVTQLVFRGQAVDLAASTRDNVARLQLPQ